MPHCFTLIPEDCKSLSRSLSQKTPKSLSRCPSQKDRQNLRRCLSQKSRHNLSRRPPRSSMLSSSCHAIRNIYDVHEDRLGHPCSRHPCPAIRNIYDVHDGRLCCFTLKRTSRYNNLSRCPSQNGRQNLRCCPSQKDCYNSIRCSSQNGRQNLSCCPSPKSIAIS